MSSQKSNDNHLHKCHKPDEKQRYGVYWFYKDNKRPTDIARQVGIPPSTVRDIVKRIKRTGSPSPGKSSGRPCKMDERAERHLRRIIRQNPSATYGILQQELAAMGIQVHKNTIISAVHRMDLKSSKIAKKPGPSKQQQKKKTISVVPSSA